MKNWENMEKTWWEWEASQVEKYEGEVVVSKTMEPIPWHGDNSRRYNIYNDIDLDIVVDVELVEEEGEYKIVEL